MSDDPIIEDIQKRLTKIEQRLVKLDERIDYLHNILKDAKIL